MEGKVKWFSADKGYGFVTGSDGVDRYFGIQDVAGTDLPKTGDEVRFGEAQGKKGPRATGVEILRRAATSSDERVQCGECGKKMVPRIITYRGALNKSVCPFCGATYKEFGWCFIASAVYDEHDEALTVLRRFRDNNLRPSLLGRAFIAIYYRLSPAVARAIRKSPTARRSVKRWLDRAVARIARD